MLLTKAAAIATVVTVILGTAATLSVLLRIYCRLRVQKIALGGDDFFIIAALVCSLAMCISMNYAAVVTRAGDPSQLLTPQQTVLVLKIMFAAEDLQIAAMGLAKTSLLLFYRRIFILPWFLTFSCALIVINGAFTVAILTSTTFSKWPVSGQWNLAAPYNLNITAIVLTYISVNAILDIVTLAMPLATLRMLKLIKQHRVFLFVICTMGAGCVAASLARLACAIEYSHIDLKTDGVLSGPFLLNGLWAMVEPAAMIISVCLLTFGPLLQSVRCKVQSWPGPRQICSATKAKELLQSPGSCEHSTPPSSSGSKDKVLEYKSSHDDMT